jgi:hypothetical protein
MVERSYLSLAGAARQPENRCLKRKLSIRKAQRADRQYLARSHSHHHKDWRCDIPNFEP